MKNLIIFVFSVTVFFVSAQEEVTFKKASDLSKQEIIIPDNVYNEEYSLTENGKAFINGSHELSKKTSYEFEGVYFQQVATIKTLVYKEGKKIQPKITKEPLTEKSVAWFIIIFTFLYYAIFSFLFRIRNENKVGLVAALIVVIMLTPLTPKDTAIMVAGGTALIAAMVVMIGVENHSFKFWVIITLLGMAIVWYSFTPIFFVYSVAGILAGSVMVLIKKNRTLKIS